MARCIYLVGRRVLVFGTEDGGAREALFGAGRAARELAELRTGSHADEPPGAQFQGLLHRALRCSFDFEYISKEPVSTQQKHTVD